MPTLLRSYSLVRNLLSLSASACRMFCCKRASRRLRSLKESGFEAWELATKGAWESRAMLGGC
jgi:hypothetical protein